MSVPSIILLFFAILAIVTVIGSCVYKYYKVCNQIQQMSEDISEMRETLSHVEKICKKVYRKKEYVNKVSKEAILNKEQ